MKNTTTTVRPYERPRVLSLSDKAVGGQMDLCRTLGNQAVMCEVAGEGAQRCLTYGQGALP